jgi:hypothetical protein
MDMTNISVGMCPEALWQFLEGRMGRVNEDDRKDGYTWVDTLRPELSDGVNYGINFSLLGERDMGLICLQKILPQKVYGGPWAE